MKLPRKSKVVRNSILAGIVLFAFGLWQSDRYPDHPPPATLFIVAVLLIVLGGRSLLKSRK